MEPQDIADFARNFTAMIRVKGPDPKGLKMRNHAFHHHHSGVTTLSASGFLLPDNLIKACKLGNSENFSILNQRLAVVVCVASVVEPFLATRSKDSSFKATTELVPYAQIHVMVERRVENSREKMHEQELPWFHAQVLRLVCDYWVFARSDSESFFIMSDNWESSGYPYAFSWTTYYA